MNDDNNCTVQSHQTVRATVNSATVVADQTTATVKSLWSKAITVNSSPDVTIKTTPKNPAVTTTTSISPTLRKLTKPGDTDSSTASIDFELGNLLGRGGMGEVYTARQSSLNRQIAIKVMGDSDNKDSVNSFLSEAVVTGSLDHPNIVPVYDLGSTENGSIFYAMKEITGQSWDQAMPINSLAHNLRIFFSLSDAVAFAHSKGIVHRDIKPENVMLGEFGETLLVDWGIAITTDKRNRLNTSLAGTPTYMAPEMASCNFDKIGPETDIYLLGGVLYEIITGLKPHTGKNIFDTISAAMENSIQPSDKSGELIEIAIKAMSTEPADRYATVKELQNSLRLYLKHEKSIIISDACHLRYSNINSDSNNNLYQDLTEIIAGFQQSIQLWHENISAIGGLRDTRLNFITAAIQNEDLTLAKSQLTAIADDAEQYDFKQNSAEAIDNLHTKLNKAVAHAKTKARLTRFSVTAVALAALATICITYSAYFITSKDRDNAIIAKKNEVNQRQKAQKALTTAQNATYFNQIALANSYLENFNPAHAEDLLEATPSRLRGWEWGYLAHLCRRPLLTIKSNLEIPSNIAFSHDGKLVAVVDSGKKINIWNSFTGKPITTLSASALGGISDIIFSTDSQHIILATHKGGIRTWNIADAKELLFTNLPEFPDNLQATSFSPDGNIFAATARKGQLYIWNLKTNVRSRSVTLRPAPTDINCITIVNNGKSVACGSNDSVIRIYDTQTGRLQKELLSPVTLSPIISISSSPNGEYLAVGTSSRLIQVWNIQLDKPCTTTSAHYLDVAALTFSANGNRLASTGSDGSINIWDPYLTTDFISLKFKADSLQALAYAPNSRTVAVTGADNSVIIISTDSWKQQQSLSGHTKPITDIRYSPDSKKIVTASRDGTARLWDIDSGTTLLELKHTSPLTSVSFSADGTQILTTDDNTAQLWNILNGECLATLKGKIGNFKTAAFSPDGNLMLTGGNNLTLWNRTTGEKVHHIKPLSSDITCATFSPDGKLIITGDQTSAILWDTATATKRFTLYGHTGAVICVGFSPDNKRAISGSLHSSYIWDTETGRELLALPHTNGWTTAIAFSPDGTQLLTSHSDGTITLKKALSSSSTTQSLKQNKQSAYQMWRQAHK